MTFGVRRQSCRGECMTLRRAANARKSRTSRETLPEHPRDELTLQTVPMTEQDEDRIARAVAEWLLADLIARAKARR